VEAFLNKKKEKIGKMDDNNPRKAWKLKQLEMIKDNVLRAPENAFWEKDFKLKPNAYELEGFEKVCPWYGYSGFNAPDNLWHGMAGARDYNFVVFQALGMRDTRF